MHVLYMYQYMYLAVCIFSINYGLNLPPFNLLLLDWTSVTYSY